MEMNHTLPGKTAVDRALASADSSWSADWRSLIVAMRRSDMLHLWCDCIELGVNLRIAAMPTDAPHYTSCTDTKTRPALSHLGCRPAPTRAGRQQCTSLTALHESAPVTGFGCRPYTELDAGATGPAFESRQGRKTRGVGHPDQGALWGYRRHRRCRVGLVKGAALL